MSFRISKTSFFISSDYIVGAVHLCDKICYSKIIRKSILLLNISVCNVKDSSVRFSTEVASLSLLKLWNSDNKLLKQQLLDNFLWYFCTGDSGWNTIFPLFLHYQLGLQIPHIFSSLYLQCFFIKFLYKNPVHVS